MKNPISATMISNGLCKYIDKCLDCIDEITYTNATDSALQFIYIIELFKGCIH